MVAAIAAVVIIGVVIAAAVIVFGGAELGEMSRLEKRLHDPATPTVVYPVPNGVDPVVISTALTRAGFTSVVDFVRGVECLRIECEPTRREEVRRTIAGVHLTSYDGVEVELDRVVFLDERVGT